MKIAIDYREAIRENKAGKGTVVLEVVEEWKKIIQDDDIFLMADRDFDLTEWPSNFHKVIYKLPDWLWHLWVIWDVWWKFDRYVALTSYLVPWLSFSNKCIIMVHDLVAFDDDFAKKHNQKATKLERLSLGGAIKNVRKIIVPSKSAQNDLDKYFKVGKDKVRLVYEGVNQYQGKIDVDKVKTKFGIDRDYVFFVGTLEPRKNLDKLIQAVAEMRAEQVWGGMVVLAGKKGWYYQELFELTEKLQLKDVIKFIGYVTDEEKFSLMRGAKVFYFVSNYEGFGLPILEAFGMGTPVLTANVSSMPEVSGRAAMMVSPDSLGQIKGGLMELLTNQDFAKSLVEKGKKQAEKFRWDEAAKEMWEIVKE